MTNSSILRAAEIIREIDPALAQAFISKPFHRHQLVTAFHASMMKCYLAPMADRIAVMLRSAIDSVEVAA
jgi:hypothetical protein